ncbi:ABC transporter ATP-binding protein [Paenibacillus sp. NEAU-GSW1]|uniref:ABC transporter ATP-binding protein n=1 Tax=Paenibacillus sp. NEAU-GSW1 TaxID=2682486 RepID=UPI0012E212AC|nr:ABC transporter ATP-binding protein [Paenibacillus sp. NEAU-GSW1]MUT66299.1 ATP-binding cassette domain-containing protein [Paenibacillus sp. NEAU-GSW1]
MAKETKNAALELKSVCKSFGRAGSPSYKQVLTDLSLEVADGEFVTIIGPSGSGKTTLFQLIGGLQPLTKGEIWIGGRETTGLRGNISYMPQQAALMPWLSVRSNIELALQIAGTAKKAAKAAAEEWLARIGLDAYADGYPHTLSGGMQQRVSFLRALLSPQPLMLLDEPFGALDAMTRQQMQRWLLSIWEANRRSVLFVTHSIEEALLLSDRIVVLSAAPAIVVEHLTVPFARPRAESLWTDPAFNAMKQHIYDLLQQTPKEEG